MAPSSLPFIPGLLDGGSGQPVREGKRGDNNHIKTCVSLADPQKRGTASLDKDKHGQSVGSGMKRFPILGPTRQDTQLFFSQDGVQFRSSPDEPITRPGSSVKSKSGTHDLPSRSQSQAFQTSNATTLLKEHHVKENIWSKPPISRSYKDIPTSNNSTTNDSYQRKGSLASRKEDEIQESETDKPGLYCVINSASTRKSAGESRGSVKAKQTRHFRDLVNSRGNQTYVLTADTASLLLQSGPPLLIRSATDIYGRKNTRSIIQQVSDTNTSKPGSAQGQISRSVASDARSHFKNKSASLAVRRSKSLHSTSSRLRQRSNTQIYSTDFESAASLATSYKYPSEDTLYSLGSAHQKTREICTPSTSYMKISTGIDGPEDFDPTMTTRILSKKLANSKLSKDKQTSKTLSPSKHGYHPRSHSPTFKRLVAASDRLYDACPTSDSLASPSESNFIPDRYYDSTSSDSVQGLRQYTQNILNGLEDSDNVTSDSSKTNERWQAHVRKSMREAEMLDSQNKQSSGDFSDSDEKARRQTRAAKRQNHEVRTRRHVSYDRREIPKSTSSEDLTTLMGNSTDPTADLSHKLGVGGSTPIVEMETRIKDGQPTQLHFFLPQLADGVSEVSGATLTGRSHYQEQRLELLNRQGPGDIREVVPESGRESVKKYYHKPTSQNIDLTLKIQSNSKQQRAPNIEKRGRNASKERLTARDIKHGHFTLNMGRQSPPKDEMTKQRRHISPLRSFQKPERPVRKKVTTYFSRPPMYLETQLPSEMLKKEIDDFPTLVSMDYSEPDSPLQVR